MENIKYFIEPALGKQIIGYSYYNGYRYVYVYVKSIYKGNYTFTLDYTYAKKMTPETACKHIAYLRVNHII